MFNYGIWSDISLHEVAHIALAGAPAGEEGLAIALLDILGRVFLLVPFCFIFIFLMKRKNKGSKGKDAKVEFPWFLVIFIILSIFGSYVLGQSISISEGVIQGISILTTGY